jgi:glycogen debranching enzyme
MTQVGSPPGDLIRIEGQFYISASSSRVDDRTQVLKEGETFAVFDRFGDIAPVGIGDLGLFHEGTRFLSRLSLRVAGERPLILSSTVTDDNTRLIVNLTNPDLTVDDEIVARRGTLHIGRELLLWQGVCYQRLRLTNYGSEPTVTRVSLTLEADFADLFEVRGIKRAARGDVLEPVTTESGLVLAYRGLDDVVRRMKIECSPRPALVTDSGVAFDFSLGPKAQTTCILTMACETGESRRRTVSFPEAQDRAVTGFIRESKSDCRIETSNARFNEWLTRSFADLHLMTTHTDLGPYPYAGVPWFSTPFGRDGIITAMETLWVNPELARGVLRFLAATQATKESAEEDAEPGKILHEMRMGEMAALGEIPFGRYYGSVDATPLYIWLAGMYYRRAGDVEFVHELWRSIEKALEWMDTWGDRDRDGFIEYHRQSATGLVQQGWKDSGDSVFHADGSLAEGPIALCEVQGYAYAAYKSAARLARAVGDRERALGLIQKAGVIRARFEEAFWCEDLGTYALALDGNKRPCRVRASNAGQCLLSGIASGQRAARVVSSLLDDQSFSGWGIRTVANTEARYNPMSYHNGSVWPHDNALIAAGFSAYGCRHAVFRVLSGMFAASQAFDLHRLPELFCGFERGAGEAPTLYPVACSPQAWAAAAPFLLLQSCLGLSIVAADGKVAFRRPRLPAYIEWVRIEDLVVGDHRVDLMLRRHTRDVGVHVDRKTGPVRVTVAS